MMEKKHEKIQLRSEKVRHIIGNELPFWVRHGITIVTVILIGVVVVAWVVWNEF